MRQILIIGTKETKVPHELKNRFKDNIITFDEYQKRKLEFIKYEKTFYNCEFDKDIFNLIIKDLKMYSYETN